MNNTGGNYLTTSLSEEIMPISPSGENWQDSTSNISELRHIATSVATLYFEQEEETHVISDFLLNHMLETLSEEPPSHYTNECTEEVIEFFDLINIKLTQIDEIQKYLNQYPDLNYFAKPIGKILTMYFYPDSQIILSVNKDPEIEDIYLKVTIRQNEYSDNLFEVMDKVNEIIREILKGISGQIFVSTDFKKPQD